MNDDYPEVAYPPPPWRLAGPAAIALGTVDIERARHYVPDDLEIVAVRPGRTAAAFVIADYQDRATFPYAELSVMAAMVRCRGVRGPWISNIYVDSIPSLKGGREMWGMDKHLATFDRSFGPMNEVIVTEGDQRRATFRWATPQRLWPAPAFVRGIGSVHGDRRRFTGRGISRLGTTTVDVDVAPDSPFFDLGLHDQPLRGVAGQMNLRFGDVRILAPAPPTPRRAAPAERTI
jgi:hypothetical protein